MKRVGQEVDRELERGGHVASSEEGTKTSSSTRKGLETSTVPVPQREGGPTNVRCPLVAELIMPHGRFQTG